MTETTENLYGKRSVADVPFYTLSDVAHHLRLTDSQISWLVGLSPMRNVEPGDAVFTFRQLVEYHLKGAILLGWYADGRFSKELYVRLQERWPDLLLSRGQQYLIYPEYEELLWHDMDRYRHSPAFQKLAAVFRTRVVFADDGSTPTKFFPFTRSRIDKEAPLAVSIDPGVRFGRPAVKGVPTEVISDYFKAGDSVDRIAKAYRILTDDVEEALRFESGPLTLTWTGHNE